MISMIMIKGKEGISPPVKSQFPACIVFFYWRYYFGFPYSKGNGGIRTHSASYMSIRDYSYSKPIPPL